MNGPSIRQVQERLNALGANPRLATDGIFGPLTEAAVIAFQRANGLNSDGIIGPVTWNAIFTNQPAPPPPPLRKTIVLDPGHGGHDPGAVNGSRLEKNDNLRLALAVRDRLQRAGQRVIMTRDTDVFVTLAERSAISNRNNADIFVSIHRNAFDNPAANGYETFVVTNPPAVNMRYAQNVHNEIINVGHPPSGWANRGVKQANFTVLRATNAPAMLLEMGFITNERDNQIFDQNFDRYADAITQGVINSIG